MRVALLLGLLLSPLAVHAAEEPAAAPALAPAAPAPAPAAAPAAPAAPAPQAAPAAAPVAAVAPAQGPVAAPASPSTPAPVFQPVDPKKKLAPDEDLTESAQVFYGAIVDKDIERLVALCRPPFHFESRSATSEAEIRRKWEASFQSEASHSLRLMGIEFLGYDEMVAKYGKSPDRLTAWPLRSGLFSVANLNGHAVVVLWRKATTGWIPVALHD